MLTICLMYCMTDSVALGSPAAAASSTAPSLSSRSVAVAAESVPRMAVVGIAAMSVGRFPASNSASRPSVHTLASAALSVPTIVEPIGAVSRMASPESVVGSNVPLPAPVALISVTAVASPACFPASRPSHSATEVIPVKSDARAALSVPRITDEATNVGVATSNSLLKAAASRPPPVSAITVPSK